MRFTKLLLTLLFFIPTISFAETVCVEHPLVIKLDSLSPKLEQAGIKIDREKVTIGLVSTKAPIVVKGTECAFSIAGGDTWVCYGGFNKYTAKVSVNQKWANQAQGIYDYFINIFWNSDKDKNVVEGEQHVELLYKTFPKVSIEPVVMTLKKAEGKTILIKNQDCAYKQSDL
jgi:hypothetical protein